MKRVCQLFMMKLLIVLSLLAVAYAQEEVTTPDDSAITQKISTNYSNDTLLNPFNIQLKALQGVVYLSGTLDTDMQYERAVRLAEATEGVNDVNTDALKVKNSQQPITDTLITAKVKGKLMREAIFGAQDIDSTGTHVETKNGTVYLSGKVDNADQKAKILEIVHSVKGIKSIKDDLTA